MYLKKIEIAGFKSFADRTKIEFDKGLTAVVGPNGSGKSNITEAVRWVLGEQSAKSLRGGKMPDIIFAGSDTRKPLNIAEVTVVLDNEERFLPLDFSEVSVTRRFSRKGDSEFFINKQSCRLKDIVDLFMDSGLGKESFSIISQGKVEAIFNSKPEDRRGIFEEAAGVLKYKQRKRQAETKLFETEDNLSRVQDIIYELEGQIVPLEEQKRDAEVYLRLTEEFTKLDVGVTVQQIQEQKEIWQQLTIEIDNILTQIKHSETEMNAIQAELEEIRVQRQDLEQIIEERQQRLLFVTKSYEQTEGQRSVLVERAKHSSQTTEEYENMLTSLAGKLKEGETALQLLIEAQKEKETAFEVAQKDVSELKEQLAFYSKSAKERLEELRSEYVEVMQEEVSVRNDLKHLEKEYSQETGKNEQLLRRFEALKDEQATCQAQLDETESKAASQEANLNQLRQGYLTASQALAQLKEETTLKEQQMYEAMGILQQAKARRDSLAELKEKHTGFYQGVRVVLENKAQLSGIIGAVAELMKVPREYALAIETALGAAAQNIVTEDESSAQAAITWLKNSKAGRATFLPLTVMKPRHLPSQIENEALNFPGCLGAASEKVQCDPKVQPIIGHLLGATILTKDLASASRLAKKLGYKYRIVSLEGDIMNPGGSMTGGRNKKDGQGNLFTQASDLERLQTDVAQMERQLQEKEAGVRQQKEQLKSYEEQVSTKRAAGEAAGEKLQEILRKRDAQRTRLTQIQKEQSLFEYDTQEMNVFLANYEERKQELTALEERLGKRKAVLDQGVQAADQAESDNEQKRTEISAALTAKQSEEAVLKEQLSYSRSEQQQKIDELAAYQEQLEHYQKQLAELGTSKELTKEDQEQLQQQLAAFQAEQSDLEQAINDLRQTKETLEASRMKLDEAASEAGRKQQLLIEAKNKLEVKQSRGEVALDNALTYLQEEYQLTFEAAEMQYALTVDLSEGAFEVKRLKQQISQLGAVNVGAIEQYAEVNERHQFLVSQRDDLMSAKDSLFSTMNEMDTEVKTRFTEVFTAIRREFQQVFPKMFGGGRADLTLTDPSDLLNTGIEIVAQPPGKKLQSLSLLSGGERALTAIALLFSIIQVRPVPFCILDEVEAALDEANVARFGRYLAHFEKETQFIVVTHRKGTMEAANVLYGVTMQESGVSKIVSVRLEDVDDRGHFPAAVSS